MCVCLYVPCGHPLGKGYLLVLVLASYCEFVTFPLVSWITSVMGALKQVSMTRNHAIMLIVDSWPLSFSPNWFLSPLALQETGTLHTTLRNNDIIVELYIR